MNKSEAITYLENLKDDLSLIKNIFNNGYIEIPDFIESNLISIRNTINDINNQIEKDFELSEDNLVLAEVEFDENISEEDLLKELQSSFDKMCEEKGFK